MTRRSSSRAAIVLFSAALWIGAGARASEDSVPVDLRLKVLFTALTYDNNLTTRGAELRVGVVSLSGNEKSQADAREVQKGLEDLRTLRVKGLALVPLPAAVKSAADLTQLVERERLNMLYLCAGLGAEIGGVASLAGERRLLAVAGQRDYVKAGAAALGVTLVQGKPKLVMSPRTATAQGASLDVRLMIFVEKLD